MAMFDRAAWRLRLVEMRSILENDKRFLLAGRIERLAAQDRRRSAIETRLSEMPYAVAREEERAIDQLRRLAMRNHRLLNAYLAGARRAALRLGAVQRESARLGAYRPDGSRVDAPTTRTTKEQRA